MSLLRVVTTRVLTLTEMPILLTRAVHEPLL
jgi:hypothetical protein